MFETILAEIRGGQIHPIEPTILPEGARVLVTVLPLEDQQFWATASQSSLETVWANEEDDVYAQLFQK
jgi:hypothetical protein